jgi:D-beta-D-heptose 7-phosphate kinase/D-beta-D-heptose 1-phosphate adenosyltransferase
MTHDRARELVGRFQGAAIVIVGDVMLDHFVVGRVNRISPEAPVPVVEFDHEEHRVGGAGNVAHNVRTLGGCVELVGLIGPDPPGQRLLRELGARAIGVTGMLVDPGRRTTTKQRIVTDRNQQVARVDFESDEDASGDIEETLAGQVERLAGNARVIVVSDYLKGAITRRLMERIVASAGRRKVPVLVDPKIPHLAYYAGTTLVTPNHHEAEVATHMRIRTHDQAARAARVFRDRTHSEHVLITRGEQGMCLLDGDQEAHFPAVAREVADVTGAGDTVIATLALALASGASLSEAAQLATHAAGVVVGKFGPATLTTTELLASVEARGPKPEV